VEEPRQGRGHSGILTASFAGTGIIQPSDTCCTNFLAAPSVQPRVGFDSPGVAKVPPLRKGDSHFSDFGVGAFNGRSAAALRLGQGLDRSG
jgi:hypothetical protein